MHERCHRRAHHLHLGQRIGKPNHGSLQDAATALGQGDGQGPVCLCRVVGGRAVGGKGTGFSHGIAGRPGVGHLVQGGKQLAHRRDPQGQRRELAGPRPHDGQGVIGAVERRGRRREVIVAQRNECRLELVEDLARADAHLGERIRRRHHAAQLRGDRAQVGCGQTQLGRVATTIDGQLAAKRGQRRGHAIGGRIARFQAVSRDPNVRARRIIAAHRCRGAVTCLLQRPVECQRQGAQRVVRRPGTRDESRAMSDAGRRPDARRAQRQDAAQNECRCDAERHAGAATPAAAGPMRRRRRATYHPGVTTIDELQRLPKAELHQHLDGALRPATAVELAAEIGMPLSADEARARLVAPPRCTDQAQLLTYFDLPIALLQTASALRRATAELIADMTVDGLLYAEIRWAPRLHLQRDLAVGEVIEAVAQGISQAAIEIGPRMPLVGLIVTAMRSHAPAANVALARTAAAFGPPVVGFDLAGPEATYPAPPHAAAFRAAEAGGLLLTAHAGEVAGPDRIREAIDLGVRRIAHGVTAIEDPAIVEMLLERDITLDLCPTSNVQAGIVEDLAHHPLARLHRAGVSVTISTDDRTVSDTTLSAELARTREALQMSRTELADVALNAFRRGFAPAAVLDALHASAALAWREWAAESVI